MNTRPRTCLAALLLAIGGFAAPARAAVPTSPLHDSNLTWDTYFSSFTSVTTHSDDVAGLGGAVSLTGRNVTGYRYQVLAVGGNATFTIAQTTKTFSPTPLGAESVSGFNNAYPGGLVGTVPIVSTSAPISVPSALTQGYEGVFEANVLNPVFTFTGLSVAATTYLWVEIGREKYR